MARLDIHNLCFSVGSTDILRNVNIQVEEGRCLALLGPSGCGKTTTLRSVAGFINPTAGDIQLNGSSIVGLPTHKRNVGLVFQDYALFPHMKVKENVTYGLRRRGFKAADCEQRVSEALDLVQLSGYEERMPNQLSGGQQQRVALARCLVLEPDILLLDEPLGALDRQLRDHMQVELKRIQRQAGITTVIVTHDQEEALSLSDEVAVMVAGEIEEVGNPVDLYERPKSRAVMEFLGASNILDATIVGRCERHLHVRTANGVEFRAGKRETKSASVGLGIRPEWFIIETGLSDDAVNRMSGRVSEAVYKGPHQEIYVDVGLEDPVIVRRTDKGREQSNVDNLANGDMVHLSVDPEAILIFEEKN